MASFIAIFYRKPEVKEIGPQEIRHTFEANSKTAATIFAKTEATRQGWRFIDLEYPACSFCGKPNDQFKIFELCWECRISE